MPSIFPCLRSRTRHPSRTATLGAADDPVGIVGNSKSKALEFQKEYLNLVGELPRDPEIVASQSRIRNECIIARPGPAIALF